MTLVALITHAPDCDHDLERDFAKKPVTLSHPALGSELMFCQDRFQVLLSHIFDAKLRIA